MKKLLFFTAAVLFFAGAGLSRAAEIDPFVKNEIVAALTRVQSPFVMDDCAIFTAAKNARFVGIAFGFENYKTIHPFERSVLRDGDGNETDSLLFYILPLPKSIERIDYRLVVDGLWTFDPANPVKTYDPRVNTLISSVTVERALSPATQDINRGAVRFVCEAPQGTQIRLAGSFNNWDSYMYYLQEVQPGIYQIDLPLPPGTYQYSFYRGMASFTDPSNSKRAYTQDGRVASVITVQ